MLLSKSNISNTLFSNTAYCLSKNNFKILFGDNESEDSRALLVWNRTAENASGTVIPLLRKYLQPTNENGTPSNITILKRQVVPLFRLAEMYLIAMECTSSISEANQLYKDFMKSRQIMIDKDFTEAELSEILKEEYRRELFAEGQMFYFYKRNSTPRMLWQVSPSDLTEVNYIVPLPESELKYQ